MNVLTDCHCHVTGAAKRHFICEPSSASLGERDVVFYGYHPWQASEIALDESMADLRRRIAANRHAGVGEIGLDRLRERNISPEMRNLFAAQLQIAAEFSRPVVLHGAKCWGEVYKVCREYKDKIPAFLFHGFSRSSGLIPDIVALGGYISIGPALLNDHAVNYRQMASLIPLDRTLVETDTTTSEKGLENMLDEIVDMLARLRNIKKEKLVIQLEENADCFISQIDHTMSEQKACLS